MKINSKKYRTAKGFGSKFLALFFYLCLAANFIVSIHGQVKTIHGQVKKERPEIVGPGLETSPPVFEDFNPQNLLREWRRAPFISTYWFEGRDLGEKINKASAKLGNRYGIIIAEGSDDFYTPAIPDARRWIFFTQGTHKSYTNNIPSGAYSYGRVIYPKDDTVISGTGDDSIIDEADDVPGQPPKHSLIAPFAGTIVPYDLGESTANILKSRNIHVLSLHFRGNRNNPANDIGLSAVTVGNDDFSSVQDCWFEAVSGYGVQVGATPGEFVVGGVLPDGRTIGYHARNCAVLRNRFENLLSQNLGLINFDGLLVADNVFLNPGRLQPDGSFSPFFTVIDVEPNGSPREIVRGYKIIRNLIDGRGAVGSRYWGGIALQITAEQFNEHNEISDNVILGSENTLSQTSFGINVNGVNTNDLTVNRNRITTTGQNGLGLTGNNIRAENNTLFNCGGGGNPAMYAENLRNSLVSNTVITKDIFHQTTDIFEAGTNTNNLWEQNEAGIILHLPDSTVTGSTYRKNVTDRGIIEGVNSSGNNFEDNISR